MSEPLKELIKSIVSNPAFGTDHGWSHSEQVAELAVKYFMSADVEDKEEELSEIVRVAAWAHDIKDTKIVGWEGFWQVFETKLREHYRDYEFSADAIVWIINNIGVSREAGKDYSGEGWSAEQWKKKCLEENQEFCLSDEEVNDLLACKHAVSAADMFTALGASGHCRAVAFNMRKLGFITEGDVSSKAIHSLTLEQKKELVKAVEWIHNTKHKNMLKWIHLDSARADIEQGIRELFEEHAKWKADLLGVTE